MLEENLEKSVFEEIPTKKIYSSGIIKAVAFFAGILAAGYCIAENFKAFNDFEKARNTWIITILSSIFFIAVSFSLPADFPNILFPIVYIGIASFIIQTYQEEKINKHIENGGETFGGWRVFLICLLSISIFLALILAISSLINDNLSLF